MRKKTLISAVALALGLSFTAPAVWADSHEGSADAGQEQTSETTDENAGSQDSGGGCGGSSDGSSEHSSEGSH